jgi:2-C-methyl-D-erythritol 2,4-cyclodiphosphate synthase
MITVRVGSGYDVHAFAADRRLILGGVAIEHSRGLAGHSDADVLTHALIDALLGAAGLGDIGDWFPSNDARFQGAPSLDLLDQVMGELAKHGWSIVNVDLTVIAQEPRLASVRQDIRRCLAERLGINVGRLSVKATTPDHLGSIGRAEGIAAQAAVLLQAASDAEGDSRL